MKKKIVPKLRQEVKVIVDIVTSDDIKIYFTGKFKDFTARYIIKLRYYIINLFFTKWGKKTNFDNFIFSMDNKE